MSSQRAIIFFSLLGLSLLLFANVPSLRKTTRSKNTEKQTRLLFTGDVLLAREVQREITIKHGQSPWANLGTFFKGADWLMGNFEGSVGSPTHCKGKEPNLCFAVQPATLDFLKQAGFTAVSLENNHIADLGEMGRKNTRQILTKKGIAALDFTHSPGFFKTKDKIIAFIAVTNVSGQDGRRVTIHSNELRQKIRLAKALSNWVIVSIHWGVELSDWPNSKQRDMATWLIKQGADVIIGHHPHVIQNPECMLGHPVFFSLGNHLFDQKYIETKQGLIADCLIDSKKLFCHSVKTKTPNNSAFPEIPLSQPQVKQLVESSIERCVVKERKPLEIDGYVIRPRLAENQFVDGDIVLEGKKGDQDHWTVSARHLLSLATGQFLKEPSEKDFLFTLENHLSDMDQEEGPRPYVYEVSPKGLIARWRGSALAWPLVDALLIKKASVKSHQVNRVYLCALHRKDAFITLKKDTKGTRTAVYTWNGFGFSGVKNSNLTYQCEHAFE